MSIFFGILILLGLLLLVAAFAGVRNDWVYRERIKAIDNNTFDCLPSYDTMFFKFWIWDVQKFIGMGEEK